MASGFFASRLKNKNVSFKKVLIKDIKRLLIPYILWALINTTYISILNDWFAHETLNVLMTFVYCDVDGGYIFAGTTWFLIGLFLCRMCYYLLSKYISNKYFLISICFVINALILVQFNGVPSSGFLRGFYFMIFYCIGDLIFESLNKVKNNYLSNFNIKSAIIIVISIIYLIVIYFKGTTLVNAVNNKFIFLELQQVIIPIGLCISIAFISMVINIPFFVEIGQNSIIFCCMESISKSIFTIIPNMFGLTIALNNPISCIIFSIAIAYILIKLIIPFINNYFPYLKGV